MDKRPIAEAGEVELVEFVGEAEGPGAETVEEVEGAGAEMEVVECAHAEMVEEVVEGQGRHREAREDKDRELDRSVSSLFPLLPLLSYHAVIMCLPTTYSPGGRAGDAGPRTPSRSLGLWASTLHCEMYSCLT